MATVYLENEQIFDFYDLRRVAELLLDTGEDVVQADIEDTSADAGARLYNLILEASSEIDSKCQEGRRYVRTDLETIIQDALDAPSDGPKAKRAAILRKLTADLTFGLMMARRGFSADKMRELAPQYEEALGKLQELYDGRRVFDIDSALSAGVPSAVKIGKNKINSSSFNQMFGIWPAANFDNRSFGGC